jgi:hypothetical protein
MKAENIYSLNRKCKSVQVLRRRFDIKRGDVTVE